ncbi:hypothetical protein BC628DRAFT_425060 [Trametes gibbosa]|nr:hypothetical protein BC628DRAFT_425060 [Trametes gibbosa]
MRSQVSRIGSRPAYGSRVKHAFGIVPPKQKRVAKPRGGKDVKTELVDQTYSTSMAVSMRKAPDKSATRGTPKDKDVSAASEPARKRHKKSKTIATAKPQPPRHTATTIKDDEGGVTRPVLTTESSTTTIQMRISLSRTPSLRARESFRGNKHPPRTLAYVQEHLQALGTVYWDMDGFECMELSALPWLAGIGGAYQPRASNESFFVNEPCKTMLPGGVSASGGGCDMIYGECGLVRLLSLGCQPDSPGALNAVPDVPDHILVDEEDVRIRLYTYGPLPASFLDALGRAVSIRREGKEENANAAAGIGITDVTEEEATGA